jgi:hypothetical protein
MLLYQLNLGKTCPTIFLNLMPLVSPYLSKAYQLNPWPCDLCDGHRNMLGAELTVSHRTSFIKFRLWPCLVHFIGLWSIWLSTCNHSYRWNISLYIVTLAQFICVAWDFLLIMSGNGVMTKNRWCRDKTEGLLCVRTWLRYSAHASIVVGSHNPLWDYINMLSSVDLLLETISMLFVKWSSNIYHLYWIKRTYHFRVWSYFFWSW